MVRTVPLAVFLIVCCYCFSLSAGAPAEVDKDYYLRKPYRPPFGPRKAALEQAPKGNDLHIWVEKPGESSATLPTFKPVIVDTSNHCPSCLPDALLGKGW